MVKKLVQQQNRGKKNDKKLTKRSAMAKQVQQKIGPTCPMAGASRLNPNFTRGK